MYLGDGRDVPEWVGLAGALLNQAAMFRLPQYTAVHVNGVLDHGYKRARRKIPPTVQPVMRELSDSYAGQVHWSNLKNPAPMNTPFRRVGRGSRHCPQPPASGAGLPDGSLQ